MQKQQQTCLRLKFLAALTGFPVGKPPMHTHASTLALTHTTIGGWQRQTKRLDIGEALRVRLESHTYIRARAQQLSRSHIVPNYHRRFVDMSMQSASPVHFQLRTHKCQSQTRVVVVVSSSSFVECVCSFCV